MDIHKSIEVRLEADNNGVMHSVLYIEGACDSTETKPTEYIADGSLMTESDSGDVYMFNLKTEAWVKMYSIKTE